MMLQGAGPDVDMHQDVIEYLRFAHKLRRRYHMPNLDWYPDEPSFRLYTL